MKGFIVALAFCLLIVSGETTHLFAQVKFDSMPVTGTITVTSFGFGKNKAISSGDASAAAINALLFVGIPGSQYELPMVPDQSKKNDPVIKDLFDGAYSPFITESILLSEAKLTKRSDGVKGKSAQYKITINCEALRRYLEKNNVIRKFGL